MGKYFILIAILLILLVGCGTAIAGKGYADFEPEQKQFYWSCIKEDCTDFLKNKQYSEWRSCVYDCIKQAEEVEPTPQDELSCEDSDAGLDYENFGTVTDNKNPDGKDDYCYTFSNGKVYLFEGQCKNNKYSRGQKSCKEIGQTWDCVEGVCVNQVCEDDDKDGICNEDEVLGCTDSEAENFNPQATEEDNSCSYKENHAPILDAIGNKEINLGEELTIELSATDEDGDELSYNTATMPTGAEINGNVFTWTPTKDQIGENEVMFVVSDGEADDSETIVVSVGEQVCTTPTDGMEIIEDTIFCSGVYDLPNGIDIMTDGVKLNCNGATLKGNNNQKSGIRLYLQKGVLENCNVENYRIGIVIGIQGGNQNTEPSDNILKNNKMNQNTYNFAITPGGKNSNWYINDVDTSNLVNGKPIYYLVNEDGIKIESLSNAGQVILVNSKNINVEGLSISNVGPGILLVNTKDTNINNNIISEVTWDGIILKYNSMNNEINENSITTNKFNSGIILTDNSDTNTINYNQLSNSVEAIYLKDSQKNKIIGNTIIESYNGIKMSYSDENTIKGNTFKNIDCGLSKSAPLIFRYSSKNVVSENSIEDSKCSLYIELSSNSNTLYKNNFINSFFKLPFVDESSGGNLFSLNQEGNYWSNHDTLEEDCQDLDNNGICDNPFVFVNNNMDNFPFTQPNGWE
jgi:parallel beta-helix repeat protein